MRKSYIKNFFLLILILDLCLFISISTAREILKEQPLVDGALLIRNMFWRCIGPANGGGRVDDIAVVETDPRIIYVATASGGLWKTTNNGVTWTPIFDDKSTSSIGDVTVSNSNPDIVWVGTGEQNNRQSSSWGDGVFKSTDAGRTWQCMGLRDSHHIGRIVIHPTNPDIVYVAAVGHLWGPNKERGLFRTTDGGKNWTNTKFIDKNTGFIDMAMDPENPHIIYAAAYQRRRTAYGFNGGGPGSGLYKTTDGGDTWVRLTSGLPEGNVGRIGIDIHHRNPNIVYAIIEHRQGGIFRSEDKGITWKKMSSLNPRPMYYSKIRIDPNNDLRIWVLGESMYFSEDGGKTFRTDLMSRFPREEYRVHGDHHAMWINRKNSDHMIIGTDGGIYISYDGGKTCDFINTLPLGQVYEISVDMQRPYHIIAGLQDNGTYRGPSANWFRQKITNEDWIKIGGSDGFHNSPHPHDSEIIYTSIQNGGLRLINLKTFEEKPLKPEPSDPKEVFRFNWNSPFLISPHDSETIYLGGNRLFISKDRGCTWEMTDDLTTQQDRDKLPIMGVLPDENTLSKHDGVDFFGTITAIAESPIRRGLIWIGTDDGNLQISFDSGKTWKNVRSNVPRVPKHTQISRIVASRKKESEAYVTFDGHQNDDFKPYVFLTNNFGENWIDITGNLPVGGTVNVIREHPRNPDLLFVGTERGAYFSIQRGNQWMKFINIPTIPVDDIAIHPRENDLIFGTHGRGVWILDDITSLEQLTPKILNSQAYLFDIRPAIILNPHRRWLNYDIKGPVGHKIFEAPNPPPGAIINYYLKEDNTGSIGILITDSLGKIVRELQAPPKAGVNRIIWDLRYGPPRLILSNELGDPPFVLPGRYSVKLKLGDFEFIRTVDVENDPRIDTSIAELKAQHDALLSIYQLGSFLDAAVRTVNDLKDQFELKDNNLKWFANLPDSERVKITTLAKELQNLSSILSGNRSLPGRPSQRSIGNNIRALYSSISSYTEAPCDRRMSEIREITVDLMEVIENINRIIEVEIPTINELLREANLPHIIPPPPVRMDAIT